jgi:hypothetical protein
MLSIIRGEKYIKNQISRSQLEKLQTKMKCCNDEHNFPRLDGLQQRLQQNINQKE